MPPADNSHFLIEASKRRHREARERTENAIASADRSANRATLVSIAQAARVSRSWIYTQADLVAAIEQLRRQRTSDGPVHKPASTESLRRRLETSLTRNRVARQQIATLTHQLEAAHGEIRRLRSAY
jgi:hypothetical protein